MKPEFRFNGEAILALYIENDEDQKKIDLLLRNKEFKEIRRITPGEERQECVLFVFAEKPKRGSTAEDTNGVNIGPIME